MEVSSLGMKVNPGVIERVMKVKLLLMDVDGVMTDGRLYYLETSPGNVVETKAFDSKDGIGLVLAKLGGLRTGLISGRQSAGVDKRAELLGMEFVVQGHRDKVPHYEAILAKAKLKDEQVAFIGDDLTDIPVMKRVGLPIAVNDAAPDAVRAARYITRRPGGKGAVREVVELILKAQGNWTRALSKQGITL